MRHRQSSSCLGRTGSHRRAMLKNLAIALLKHGTIRTTLSKAKLLSPMLERLVTISKVDSVHRRRLVFSKLRHTDSVKRLFNEIGPRYRERPGGYLRVLKHGYRSGDQALMAIVQFVKQPLDDEEGKKE